MARNVQDDRIYFYLHGFASSPNSAKGKLLQNRWIQLGHNLCRPDLNAGDFAHLTLTRQIQQVRSLIRSVSDPTVRPQTVRNQTVNNSMPEPTSPIAPPLYSSTSTKTAPAVTLIGSSLGGLIAAWVGECCPQVDRLILLAPAFGFLHHWLPKIQDPSLEEWRSQQWRSVYHYGTQRNEPLHYDFVVDLQQYDETQLQRAIPTLIVHGRQDEVIPIQASQTFAAQRSYVELVELEDDHALAQIPEASWQKIEQFSGAS
ncbi:MAG: YqiA/YcfP family alpha/beta fold hydrolase [Synechococcales bacterium]|nr:YqiA/YcfP family alpha/beta fold hydrolase [Synechococcales bacterium]